MDHEAYLEEMSRVNNELVNLQRELAKKNSQLEKLNQLKNQFLGVVAHDLRKPLFTVVAYAEYLIANQGKVSSTDCLQSLELIHKAGWRMNRMIDELLDISLIESGQFIKQISPTQLADVIKEAIEYVSSPNRLEGVTIKVDHSPELPLMMIDGPKIEQALINLIGNAVDHGGPNTTITVTVRHDESSCWLIVADDGPGIPPEKLEMLFETSRLHQSKKASGERSTGLGLIIVNKIVEAHGGEISVQSTLGEGSEFTIRLPIS